MIIIKTKNGDRFINDKAVTMVEHDKEKAVVNAYGDNGVFFHIEDVEAVLYTNDTQPTSWQDEGSEIQRLRKELEKLVEKYDQEKIYSRYTREWFLIYEDALFQIKRKTENAEQKDKDICVNIVSIIEDAEKKYKGSQKYFEKLRAKWEE